MITLPAFVDGHCHLDKTFLGLPWMPHRAADSVAGRIDAERAMRGTLALPAYDRAKVLLRKMVAFGTTALRTHVDIDTARKLDDLHAILRLREETREHVAMQIVAFPQSGILRDPGTYELLDAALGEGADLVGGLDPATIDRDPVGQIDAILSWSSRAGASSSADAGRPQADVPACQAGVTVRSRAAPADAARAPRSPRRTRRRRRTSSSACPW